MILKVAPLLNAAATEQAVRSGATGAAYVHLSCQGSFNWVNPMDSALYFYDDQPLTLSEFMGEFNMERFYRNHLEKGMALPTALREAQLWLRHATRQELGDYYKSFIQIIGINKGATACAK